MQRKSFRLPGAQPKEQTGLRRPLRRIRDRTSCENTARKRMTSPFRRFRERTLSKERLANRKEGADHKWLQKAVRKRRMLETTSKMKGVASSIQIAEATVTL